MTVSQQLQDTRTIATPNFIFAQHSWEMLAMCSPHYSQATFEHLCASRKLVKLYHYFEDNFEQQNNILNLIHVKTFSFLYTVIRLCWHSRKRCDVMFYFSAWCMGLGVQSLCLLFLLSMHMGFAMGLRHRLTMHLTLQFKQSFFFYFRKPPTNVTLSQICATKQLFPDLIHKTVADRQGENTCSFKCCVK